MTHMWNIFTQPDGLLYQLFDDKSQPIILTSYNISTSFHQYFFIKTSGQKSGFTITDHDDDLLININQSIIVIT